MIAEQEEGEKKEKVFGKMWSPFWTPRESVTIIRRYHSKDYRHVRKILEDGNK